MNNLEPAPHWRLICNLDEIAPNTGVCALVDNEQIAVFRVKQHDTEVFAIGNYDPNAEAAVLSRGLIGSFGERVVVASPIYKHARVELGRVWVAI